MSNIYWLSSLPQDAMITNQPKLTTKRNKWEFQDDFGQGMSRQLSEKDEIELKFLMSNEQVANFKEWFRVILKRGGLYFMFRLPRTNTYVDVRIINDPVYEYLEHEDYYFVNLKFETMAR